MIHPILRLAASQPQLIGDHVEAYAELIGSEVKRTGAAWTRRAVLFAASAMLMLLGLVFTGVALMLWAALPPSGYQAGWVLIAVPGVVLVGAVASFFITRTFMRALPAEFVTSSLRPSSTQPGATPAQRPA